MGWVRTVAREIFGLFVEDGSFAVALLAWVAAACLGARLLHVERWGGVALFVGLVVVLAESTIRAARRRR